MNSGFKVWYEKYFRWYAARFAPVMIEEGDDLPYLRSKLFYSILLLLFPIGVMVYIPSVIISVVERQYIIGVADTIAMASIFLISLSRRLTTEAKKIIFAVNFYLLGVVLFAIIGTKGPGILLLITTSVLITLFQGKRAGLIAVIINALVFFSLMPIIPLNPWKIVFFAEYPPVAWIGIGINFIAFNAVIVLAVSSLLERLNESILHQKKLQEMLRKERLELLEAKQKAEESDRLKSAFLAGISHEIRTPMNGIIGFSELLREPMLTGDQQQHYLRIIEKSSLRMLNIIEQLVDISRIETGQVEVTMESLDLNELFDLLVEMFTRETAKKGLSLKAVKPVGGVFHILTDPDKLETVLSNLIGNAIKYTFRGSVEFGYECRDEYLHMYVRDTGIGIPANRLEAIFDRFVQADIADKNAMQGAGLGLSIAKAYVHLLQGTIRVESEPEKGSVFFISVPLNRHSSGSSVQPETVVTAGTNRFSNRKVLIAEDDETSVKLLTLYLRSMDMQVLTTSSGTEAAEIARANPDIGVILMDIMLPAMNGYEATREIRKFNKEVVIVAQTAYALLGEEARSLEAGCNAYITKPIYREELVELIRKWLNP